MTRSVLLLLLSSLAASPALAQDCVAGMVRTEGYCCWQDQSFSASVGRCVGLPTCPPGMRVDATGTDCQLVLSEPQAITATASLDIDALWPAAGASGPPGGRDPRMVVEPDHTARDAGIATFVAGWLFGAGLAAIFASIDHTFEGTSIDYATSWTGRGRFAFDCADLSAGLAFIPIVGALVGASYVAACPHGSYENNVLVGEGTRGNAGLLVGAVPATLAQIVGLLVMLVGWDAGRTVPRLDLPSASLEIGVTAGGTGLTLRF